MVTINKVRQVALSFPESLEQPHFEKASFRVAKKIFATLDESKNLVSLKLSEMDQDLFSKIDSGVIYPVPNKWGKQGWTFLDLSKADEELVLDALKCAYCQVAPKRLVSLLEDNDERIDRKFLA